MVPLRADTEMQARIEELADKCTEGRLTPGERDEYEVREIDIRDLIARHDETSESLQSNAWKSQ